MGCRNQYCVFQVIGCPFWSFPSTFSFSLATSGCCQNLLKIWGYMNNLDNRGRANSTKFKPPCKMCGQLGQPWFASSNGWDTCPALLCSSTSYIWIRVGHRNIVDKSSAYGAKRPGVKTQWRKKIYWCQCVFICSVKRIIINKRAPMELLSGLIVRSYSSGRPLGRLTCP